jgi:polysaccharide export outer membrane protein
MSLERTISLFRLVRAALLCLSLLPALAACGTPADRLPPIADAGSTDYLLGPGDQVRIITFGGEQLTGEFRVNPSGEIALPLLGNVRAAGLTSKQLEASVAAALKRSQLYKEPSVSVEVIAYRPIFILGEVAKPGQYAYQPGMTVVTAVAVAGGYTYRAMDDVASIVRTVHGRAVEGRAARQTYVEPGDVITIYERHF